MTRRRKADAARASSPHVVWNIGFFSMVVAQLAIAVVTSAAVKAAGGYPEPGVDLEPGGRGAVLFTAVAIYLPSQSVLVGVAAVAGIATEHKNLARGLVWGWITGLVLGLMTCFVA